MRARLSFIGNGLCLVWFHPAGLLMKSGMMECVNSARFPSVHCNCRDCVCASVDMCVTCCQIKHKHVHHADVRLKVTVTWCRAPSKLSFHHLISWKNTSGFWFPRRSYFPERWVKHCTATRKFPDLKFSLFSYVEQFLTLTPSGPSYSCLQMDP